MVSKNIQLTISEDQVGQFIGARGINIKKFIIGATKKRLSSQHNGEKNDTVDLSGIFCQISVTQIDDVKNVFAEIKANNEEQLDILEGSLMHHQDIFKKKNKEKS